MVATKLAPSLAREGVGDDEWGLEVVVDVHVATATDTRQAVTH